MAVPIILGQDRAPGDPDLTAPPVSTVEPTTSPPAVAEPTTPPAPSTPPPSPSETVEPSPTETDDVSGDPIAYDAIALLTVSGRAPMTDYDRDLFAYRRIDHDRNGCDVRNDVLRRDLAEFAIRPGTNGCLVETGVLADPYTGEDIDFVRGVGTSSQVQIDHVVALANAWVMGAQQWDEETMHRFGNDPLNLLAVDGPANQQKGAGDTATWLPSNRAFRCEYVARQVSVKVAYELRVTAAEKAEMERILAECPNEPLLTAEDAATP